MRDLEVWRRVNSRMEGRGYSDNPSSAIPWFLDFLYYRRKLIFPATQFLDVGCGYGRNSIFIGEKGGQVIGIDFDDECIRTANQRKKDLSNVEFRGMDLRKNWEFRNNSIDVIIDCNATICIPDRSRPKVIREAHRVLKREGYYCFFSKVVLQEGEKYPGPVPRSYRDQTTHKFKKIYSTRELEKVYTKKGFILLVSEEEPGADGYYRIKAIFKKK